MYYRQKLMIILSKIYVIQADNEVIASSTIRLGIDNQHLRLQTLSAKFKMMVPTSNKAGKNMVNIDWSPWRWSVFTVISRYHTPAPAIYLQYFLRMRSTLSCLQKIQNWLPSLVQLGTAQPCSLFNSWPCFSSVITNGRAAPGRSSSSLGKITRAYHILIIFSY